MAETKLRNQATGLIGAKVYLSTDQNNIGTSATKILFDSETFDTGSAFASNKFTVPTGKAGYYLIHLNVYIYSATTDQQQMKAMIYRNGALSAENNYLVSGTNVGLSPTSTTVIHLDATDYIEFYCQSANAGSDIYSPSTHTWGLVQQLTQD